MIKGRGAPPVRKASKASPVGRGQSAQKDRSERSAHRVRPDHEVRRGQLEIKDPWGRWAPRDLKARPVSPVHVVLWAQTALRAYLGRMGLAVQMVCRDRMVNRDQTVHRDLVVSVVSVVNAVHKAPLDLQAQLKVW